ncbi:hypothetical protein GGX14DRAFT_397274 [Mycena pura]|uniref:Uncharacterized protein n=1 Tax=Mycena pura TaxID=153505 RepID=A0AAD6VCK5_9AGAR|nr:hypothetical protein GGX14DRAFT_397274 [Mycena pura]
MKSTSGNTAQWSLPWVCPPALSVMDSFKDALNTMVPVAENLRQLSSEARYMSQLILLLLQPELPRCDGGQPEAISGYQTTGISYPGYGTQSVSDVGKWFFLMHNLSFAIAYLVWDGNLAVLMDIDPLGMSQLPKA